MGASLLFQYNPPMAIMTEINKARLLAADTTPYLFMHHIETLGYAIYDQFDAKLISPVTEESLAVLFQRDERNNEMLDCVAIRQWDFDVK